MNGLKVAAVLAGFLLAAGMGSANLLDSFGIVSGEADVEGPTFVVASEDRIIPENKFEDDGFPWKPLDKTTLDYYSDTGIPESNWYPMELTYYLDAEIDGDDSPGLVEVEMTLRGKDGSNSYRICTGTLEITNREDKEVVEDSCEGELGAEVNEFELELNLITDDGEIQYSGTGDTRVEVNAQ